jgi:hypothetical protein
VPYPVHLLCPVPYYVVEGDRLMDELNERFDDEYARQEWAVGQQRRTGGED